MTCIGAHYCLFRFAIAGAVRANSCRTMATQSHSLIQRESSRLRRARWSSGACLLPQMWTDFRSDGGSILDGTSVKKDAERRCLGFCSRDLRKRRLGVVSKVFRVGMWREAFWVLGDL